MLDQYFNAMHWALAWLSLPLLLGAGLAAFAATLLGYGRLARRILAGPGPWRALSWWLVVAVLAWVALDLTALLAVLAADLGLPAGESATLRPVLETLQTWPREYLDWLAGLLRPWPAPPGVSASRVVLAALGLKLPLIAVLMLAAGGSGRRPAPAGRPGGPLYPLAQGWRDLGAMGRGVVQALDRWYGLLADGAAWAWRGPLWLPVVVVLVGGWPVLLPLGLAGVLLPALAVLVVVLPLLVLTGLGLGLLAAGLLACAWLLRVGEGLLVWPSGAPRCDAPGCQRAVPRPVYRCPDCGTGQPALSPGRFGLWSHRCQCGRALPTLLALGKGGLPAQCSHCGATLSARHGPQLLLALWGSTAAGKTTWLYAALEALAEGRAPWPRGELTTDEARADYQRLVKGPFARGQPPAKTAGRDPRPWLVWLRRRRWPGPAVNLHLFDLPGEVPDSESARERQGWLGRADALALVIDPLAFGSLRTAWSARRLPWPADACTADPLDLVDGLIAALEHHAGLRRLAPYRGRLAVILTKGDRALVQERLGVAPGPAAGLADDDGARSRRLRAWLAAHELAFLQHLEGRFSQVRFFLVSAMGTAAVGQTGAWAPRGVLGSLNWLLAGHRAIRRPRLTGIATALVGLVLIAALLTGLIGLPVAGWRAQMAAVGQVSDGLLAWFPPRTPGASAPALVMPPRTAAPPPPGPGMPPPPTLSAAVLVDIAGEPAPAAGFLTRRLPLTYRFGLRDWPSGAPVRCEWWRDGPAEGASTPITAAAVAGAAGGWTCTSGPALPPGEYRVYAAVGTQALPLLAFRIAPEPVLVSTTLKDRDDRPVTDAGVPRDRLPLRYGFAYQDAPSGAAVVCQWSRDGKRLAQTPAQDGPAGRFCASPGDLSPGNYQVRLEIGPYPQPPRRFRVLLAPDEDCVAAPVITDGTQITAPTPAYTNHRDDARKALYLTAGAVVRVVHQGHTWARIELTEQGGWLPADRLRDGQLRGTGGPENTIKLYSGPSARCPARLEVYAGTPVEPTGQRREVTERAWIQVRPLLKNTALWVKLTFLSSQARR